MFGVYCSTICLVCIVLQYVWCVLFYNMQCNVFISSLAVYPDVCVCVCVCVCACVCVCVCVCVCIVMQVVSTFTKH